MYNDACFLMLNSPEVSTGSMDVDKQTNMQESKCFTAKFERFIRKPAEAKIKNKKNFFHTVLPTNVVMSGA